jgi:hypothetical protein
VVLGKSNASDGAGPARETSDEGDVLTVVHGLGEKLDSVSTTVARLGARACRDGVSERQNLAIAGRGTGIESSRASVGRSIGAARIRAIRGHRVASLGASLPVITVGVFRITASRGSAASSAAARTHAAGSVCAATATSNRATVCGNAARAGELSTCAVGRSTAATAATAAATRAARRTALIARSTT